MPGAQEKAPHDDLVRELGDMGVSVEFPETSKEEHFAFILDDLAQFVLEDEAQETYRLLSQESDPSVGELSGGNCENSIYRISILDKEESEERYAAEILIDRFNQRNQRSPFSVSKLKSYMLLMCNKRNDGRTYDRLGNLMFILSFGPVHGQVRHIDHMNPNLQICLYMSRHCPSTIIYDMKDPPINSCIDLLYYWKNVHRVEVPQIIEDVLVSMGDVRLKDLAYARHFAASWISLNHHLLNFGRLYQPVLRHLQVDSCDPGTTLIAGGANHVHAGPPSAGPRMFAFATGIPSELADDSSSSSVGHQEDIEDNDGEVQYSPALLHLDLTCILFGMMHFENDFSRCNENDINDAKRFLLERLLPLLKEYPHETYELQLGDERQPLKEWLQQLVPVLESPREVESLLELGSSSDSIFFSPDVQSRAFRKLRQRQLRRTQRQSKKGARS